MKYWQRISPSGALAELSAMWRENPNRWPVLALSAVLTGGLLYGFLPENQRILPRPPEVTWITTFAEGRTDAEIIASNQENQRRQEELRALNEERLELRREMYRQLGRATGLDVDAMEEQIRQDEAAEAAERARPAPAASDTAQADSVETAPVRQ